MKEEWKTFAKGNYEVSNHGRVRRKTPGHGTWAGRELKLVYMGMGYYVVNPVINGKNVLMYVHHIVARNFLGQCPDNHEINHIDGDKLNNSVSNLEYVTHQENMIHARSLNLINDVKKYTDAEIKAVRDMALDGFNPSEISRATGISRRYCSDIIKGKSRVEK